MDPLDPNDRGKIASSIEVGSPRGCILEQAKRGGYDLIVMGTHGRTGRVHSLAGERLRVVRGETRHLVMKKLAA